VRGLSMRDVESLCEQAGLGSCLSLDPPIAVWRRG
jgi:hypothetical protein